VVEDVAVKYTMFDAGGDVLRVEGNGPDQLVHRDSVGNDSVLRGSDVLDVGDRVSSDSGPYTLADDIDGDASKTVATGPAGKEDLSGNVNNIDQWVGGVVLDVGDILSGVDAADADGNDPLHAPTAGGSASLQADPHGQANGIIAVLIGLNTDTQGPLSDAGLPLD
jgi:hypothetical protein